METPHLQRLLRRVANREYVAAWGTHFHRAWLAAAGVALAWVVSVRLLALLPGPSLGWLWICAALALVVSLLLTRRPSDQQTARLIDERTGARELFLTASTLGANAGAYGPIVAEQAETRAQAVKPAQVVPFQPWRGIRDGVLALVIVVVASQFTPQLDPLKREAKRQKTAEQEQRLIETRKKTEVRRQELAQGDQQAKVQEALAQLDKVFKEIKPEQKETAIKQLTDQQKELGDLWKKVSNDQLRNAFDQSAQSFGQTDPKKMEEWREAMKKGDVSPLKKELEDIQKQMEKLAGMADSADKRAQQEQLAQRLNELSQGMKQLASSPNISEALQRTLEQLDLSKISALSKEAMQSAMDSLKLSQEELDRLAQAIKDGKQLEEAMKNLQMAKQLAEKGQLKEGECKNCQGQGDYAALFEQKMAAMGNGQPGENSGSGMGAGIGNGAKRPENESTKSSFKTEQASSQLTGGKLLLEWKTKEVGETGTRSEDYLDALKQVRQGVSEAIEQEQVPPGYHDAIKRYFDSLPEKR